MAGLNKYGEIEGSACPSCGNPVQSDWVACPHCTNLLSAANCPKCGKPQKAEWKICPYCAGASAVDDKKDKARLFQEAEHDLFEYERFMETEKLRRADSSAAINAFAEALEMYRQANFPSRVSDWSKAAELGSKEAQYLLACCYNSGRYGVEKNESLALQWFRKAADTGLLRAERLLESLVHNHK